jgi:hypothetical protein
MKYILIMDYFDTSGQLKAEFARPLLDMGWHAFGDDHPHLDREHFARLSPESVFIIEFEGQEFIDEGNPQGKVILIEVGYSAHSVWDLGREEAERIAEMIRGVIRESIVL